MQKEILKEIRKSNDLLEIMNHKLNLVLHKLKKLLGEVFP